MTTECRVCQAKTPAFLCRTCSDQLEHALADLPVLVDALVTSTVRQAHVYRATNRRREPDQDWRGATHALPPHAMPVDLDASLLLRAAGNTLTTWARHVAESRDAPLALSTGQAMEGPVCAGHEHDFTVEGCGHHPEQCKQLHPDHVHSMKLRGCGLDADPKTGEPRCQEHHCTHRSCEVIRHGGFTGTAAALVRWLLLHPDAIRYDEAAGEMHREITTMRDEIARAVDRTPSPLYAGPCHAEVTEPVTTERNGTIYVEVLTHRCQRDLYAWPGSESIVCDGSRATKLTDAGYRITDHDDEGCGTEHSFADRKTWLLDAVEDELLPLEMIHALTVGERPLLRLLWPNASTIRSWRARGRLIVRGVDLAGRELFRGGDVLELCRDEKTRTGPKRRAC